MATEKPGKVSKSHRTGQKQVPREVRCAAGHVMRSVFVAGSGMRRACECSGYAPLSMDVKVPYAQIKDGYSGKTRMAVRDAGSRPQRSE